MFVCLCNGIKESEILSIKRITNINDVPQEYHDNLSHHLQLQEIGLSQNEFDRLLVIMYELDLLFSCGTCLSYFVELVKNEAQ